MNDAGRACALPALSVVLIGAGDIASLQRTLRHLRAQSAAAVIEVLIGLPSGSEAFAIDAQAMPFHSFELIDTGTPSTTARARATVIAEATAPVVAFIEDHSFPEPWWAQRLIDAHRGPHVAVATTIGNANPGSMLSWANFLIEYGVWTNACETCEPDHLPGHNGSYKRDALLRYEPRMSDWLEAESVLQWDLVAQGDRLSLLPETGVFHLNHSTLAVSIELRFAVGRCFAASRSADWSAMRRWLYAAACPAIPLVRLTKLFATLGPGPHRLAALRALPALFPLLILDGMGEGVGYLSGAGRSMERLGELEMQRVRFLRTADKPLID